jgi:purine-binding chemotaxis protein CheW
MNDLATVMQTQLQQLIQDAPEEKRQLLRFALSDDLYGIPIEAVREILQVGVMTQVPMMPRFVRGVMNLRGAVVPVLDLGLRLGLQPTRISRRTCIVIVETFNGDGTPLRHGVLVDAVHEVLEVTQEQINAVPALGTRVAPQFIAGVTRVHDQSVEVLEVPRVFDDTELSRLVEEHCDQSRWLH